MKKDSTNIFDAGAQDDRRDRLVRTLDAIDHLGDAKFIANTTGDVLIVDDDVSPPMRRTVDEADVINAAMTDEVARYARSVGVLRGTRRPKEGVFAMMVRLGARPEMTDA